MQFQLTQKKKDFLDPSTSWDDSVSAGMERLSEGEQSDEPRHCHYPPVHNGGKISSDGFAL